MAQLVAQEQYFALLAEFFERATGETVQQFSSIADFADTFNRNLQDLSKRKSDAFKWMIDAFHQDLEQRSRDLWRAAQVTPGPKLVLGGGSRLGQSQLDAVTRSLLVADTILIPDPVLPWLEVTRKEERFGPILMLQQVHALLHLAPLLEAAGESPPVVVFPSWEKTLEASDAQTQGGIRTLACALVGSALGRRFESVEDLSAFVDERESDFLVAIDQAQLFVSPGGWVGEPLPQALDRYRADIKKFRSESVARTAAAKTDGQLALVGVLERAAAPYHLLENADAFSANPMVSLRAHWHYLEASSRVLAEELDGPRSELSALASAIAGPSFDWIDSISIDDLVRLRDEGEFANFRMGLHQAFSAMRRSSRNNLQEVAREVRGVTAALVEKFEKEKIVLSRKYRRKYGWTATAVGASAVGMFVPILAPWIGLGAPLALAMKYGAEKHEELRERESLEGSLMGVFAGAQLQGAVDS